MHAISISGSSLFIFINIKVEKLSLSFWLTAYSYYKDFFRGQTTANVCWESYWSDQTLIYPPLSNLTSCLYTKDLAEEVLALNMSKVQFIFTYLGPAGLLRIAGTRQLCLALSVTVTSRKPIITGKPSKSMSAYGLQKEKTFRLK